jgi:hypothetical protein
VNEGTLTSAYFKRRLVPHWRFADEMKIGWQRVGCAKSILRADSVSIHGGAWEFGQWVWRDNIRCRDPAQGVVYG